MSYMDVNITLGFRDEANVARRYLACIKGRRQVAVVPRLLSIIQLLGSQYELKHFSCAYAGPPEASAAADML
jgi:hypothetical protein